MAQSEGEKETPEILTLEEADGGIFENGSFRVEYDTVIWQSGE
jgi:hypothetical protein